MYNIFMLSHTAEVINMFLELSIEKTPEMKEKMELTNGLIWKHAQRCFKHWRVFTEKLV